MKKHVVFVVSAVAMLGLAACSSSATKVGPAAAAPVVKASASASSEAPFGPACASVPTDPANGGSFDAMSKVPVATAASGNAQLKTLVTAVNAAGLGDTLNNAPALTVFAPDNTAFAAVPSATLSGLMADKAQLTKTLEYHVVSGKIPPDQLAGTHKTLEGGTLTVTGSGENFTVNGDAMVVCGDIQTANAIVYIVDSVLTPTN
jgi:uncharacterized surface protein with fasciclin (FAS1) repeats